MRRKNNKYKIQIIEKLNRVINILFEKRKMMRRIDAILIIQFINDVKLHFEIVHLFSLKRKLMMRTIKKQSIIITHQN